MQLWTRKENNSKKEIDRLIGDLWIFFWVKNFLQEKKARLKHKKKGFFTDTIDISYGIQTPLKEI